MSQLSNKIIKRINAFEANMNIKISNIEKEINVKITKLEKDINVQIKELNNKIDKLDEKVSILETNINLRFISIENRVDLLEKKLSSSDGKSKSNYEKKIDQEKYCVFKDDSVNYDNVSSSIKTSNNSKKKGYSNKSKKENYNVKEKVSFKKILLNKKNKDTIRDVSKKENPKIPKTQSAKIRNVSNKVKKENRLINNNPRLNSFRTII